MTEQVAGTANQDEGKKVVPESDLIAVKRAAERREEELTKELSGIRMKVTETTGSLDETRTSLLKVQAEKEQLEEQYKEATNSKINSEGLQKELDATKMVVGDLESKLLDQRKTSIVNQYGIGAEALEGKTMEQLGLFEEALKLVTDKKPVGVDIGGGIAGATALPTAWDKCAEELAAAKQKSKGG
jgi:chromosome segregation ATPase